MFFAEGLDFLFASPVNRTSFQELMMRYITTIPLTLITLCALASSVWALKPLTVCGKVVSLDATRLTCPEKTVDADLQGLTLLKKLQILHLRDTKVTDAGLKHLDGLKALDSLHLQLTKVTDTGMKHLAKLRTYLPRPRVVQGSEIISVPHVF